MSDKEQRPAIWKIARWQETSETSESRKYKSLPWISSRVDFNSTGWNEGVCEFGMDWFAIYCCFDILRRVAATSKIRGVLCGEKGEPFTARRILMQAHCFIPGMQDAESLMERCIEWSKKVGWLIPFDPSGESSDDIPTRRENLTATERNGTEQNRTLRNGTERNATPDESPPCRAVVLETSELPNAEQRPTKAAKPPNGNRPAPEPLAERAKRTPILQQLATVPVSPAGNWLGSVFRRDKLKQDDIHSKPAAFWVTWYREQLTAPAPEFANANQSELCFVLAAVYAVRRCSESSLSGTPRIARWIYWIKNRETNEITDADFSKSAAAIERHFADPPAAPAEPPENTEPRQIHRPRGIGLKAERARLRELENAS